MWLYRIIKHQGVCYDCAIKVYGTGSEYGINNGKISKLWVKNIDSGVVVINYDRGWDIKPDARTQAIYEQLINEYN